MDRPPEDPAEPTPDEATPLDPAPAGAVPGEPAEEQTPREGAPAPPSDPSRPAEVAPSAEAPPAQPEAPFPDADGAVPGASAAAPPWAAWAPPAAGSPPDAAPAAAYPLMPPPPDGQVPGYAPPPEPEAKRPGVGPGVATGCGFQVLAVILFFVTGALIPSFYGALWPFILFTVGSALLLISRRWRRFATGALIVCAATWIVVLGPCIALIQPTI